MNKTKTGKRKISVRVGFDGSSPHKEEGIRQEDKNTFAVFPSWRDEEGISEEERGKGFRLGVEVDNNSTRTKEATLNIDWEDKKRVHMKYRDFVFVKGEKCREWQLVPALIDGSRSIVKLNLSPGKTLVYLNPKYNYTDNERFVEKVSRKGLMKKNLAGKSEEGRNIWALSTGKGGIKVLVMARNHAYESAGNYCVEGMIDYLLSSESLAAYFLNNFTFYFLPMTNPDGVHNGLSRLTSPQGADMNRLATVPDKAHTAIKRVLDQVRPHLFINIHNWMGKSKDGLLCRKGEFAKKIVFYMPDQIKYGKKWYIEDEEELFRKRGTHITPLPQKSWKCYCAEEFGSTGLVFEFPWFGRNTGIMKQTGMKALKAVLFAHILEI